MGLDYKPWAAKHTAILSHRYEESYQLICDIGFTAGVFTPPSGEQDQLGDCTNFAMEGTSVRTAGL